MSHDELLSWLMKTGCGWLGWKPDEVLDADMSDLFLAYEGKVDMLEACYGDPSKKRKKPVEVQGSDGFDAAWG